MDEFDEFIKEKLPKSLLTEEQFNEMKVMIKPHAIKYIKNNTDLGLKECAIYYDEYLNK